MQLKWIPVVAAVVAVPVHVHASERGQTGFSGKNGATCTSCHTGGTTPTVEITGPATLAAGEKASYSLFVRGGPAVKAGTNIAASTGTVLTAGTGLRKGGSELTHSSPLTMSAGEGRFDFEVTAPSKGGNVTLYAAGNSANGNGRDSGDGVAKTTFTITVTGGTGETDGGSEPVEETSDAGPTPGGSNNDRTEDSGGCTTAGVGGLLAAGLLVVARRRR